ncbi:hypothetical protein QCE63_08215 [Caballeronia sp. LZ065]|uniref:hypothetical protein n=1 Tax=Caballeronia sp. LZ065 TaxID=3038571 RepID=UPI0028678B92|nr:hypothetical protein [Caballeronia sp. LZ065]MDR5779411.1 hypothetical protein [Caballeronia sp. LZ065]
MSESTDAAQTGWATAQPATSAAATSRRSAEPFVCFVPVAKTFDVPVVEKAEIIDELFMVAFGLP